MPTAHKSMPFTFFHVALNRRLFGAGNNFMYNFIAVILNLKFFRRVAYLLQIYVTVTICH